jgi:hypothetical protein
MEKESYQLSLMVGLVAFIALIVLSQDATQDTTGMGYSYQYRSGYYGVGPCNDRIDNDGDGEIDWPRDDGCTSRRDGSENQLGRECDDGLDNDGNGKVDYPNDAGCTSINDRSEYSDVSFSGCGDSDGGYEPNKAGVVYVSSGFHGVSQNHPFYDRCYSNYAVLEYTCSQGKATYSIAKCDTGVCRDSQCVQRPLHDFLARR